GVRELLLVGLAPPPRRVRVTRGVPPAAVHPGGPRRDAEGRLRAVRWWLAHVYRDALRAARGAYDRLADPGPVLDIAAARLPPCDPPDADDQPPRRPARDHRGALSSPRRRAPGGGLTNL